MGFGPTTRSYIDVVTVRPWISTDQSFLSAHRSMRKHIVMTWNARPAPRGRKSGPETRCGDKTPFRAPRGAHVLAGHTKFCILWGGWFQTCRVSRQFFGRPACLPADGQA